MSSYLPYIIVAGIGVIFFIICMILFSGNKAEKNHQKQEKAEQQSLAQKRAEEKAAWAQIEALNDEREAKRRTSHSQTAPVSRISTVTVRERAENPDETAFVTTKGEAVRRNGQIVYEEAPQKNRKKKENFDATRVLSRDEIIEAMDKVDKEEAAAYKAETEEAKKKREEEAAREATQEEAQRKAAEKEMIRQREEATRKRRAAAAAQHARLVSDEEPEDTTLAQMAAVVSKDLAEKDQPAGKNAPAGDADATTVIPAAAVTAAAAAASGTAAAAAATAATAAAAAPVTDQTTVVRTAAAVRKGAAAVHTAPADEGEGSALSDKTQIMKPIKTQKHDTAPGTLGDETRRMQPLQVDTAAKDTEGRTAPAAAPASAHTRQENSRGRNKSPWGNDLQPGTSSTKQGQESIWAKDAAANSTVVRDCAYHFLGQYGIAGDAFQQHVKNITAAAFNRLGCRTDDERERAVAPLLVQEALQNVQKTYAAQPEDYVATMALRAFEDIVRCPVASTRHLVAMDALKVMPYLGRGHYQILAILLLFLYSRNSHNVDKTTFCQYIDKYVMPFLDHFPTERPYYQQLDYLHCTALEAKETRFPEILSDSYPLLFRYRGFTEEELRKALKGHRIPREYVVRSFNSPLIKLALVDDSMALRFFRVTGITDREMQDRLMRLAKKRPANFSGEEALDIMEDISPILADLGDIWDSTLLRVSTLSLLGLYLAQGYVKEMIGEEFDLSRWFE